MSFLDRPYLYSPNRLSWIQGLEQQNPGISSGGSDPSVQSPIDAGAARATWNWLTQGEAARTSYLHNFLGGGTAGPTYGGIVSGPEGNAQSVFTQGDRAVKAFQDQWEPGNLMHTLQQMGINVGGGVVREDMAQRRAGYAAPQEPDPLAGQRAAVNDPGSFSWLQARGMYNPSAGTVGQTWNANTQSWGVANPGSMMQPSGVMGQIGNNYGWNANQQPMMNNAGWGQANDYWGNGW